MSKQTNAKSMYECEVPWFWWKELLPAHVSISTSWLLSCFYEQEIYD